MVKAKTPSKKSAAKKNGNSAKPGKQNRKKPQVAHPLPPETSKKDSPKEQIDAAAQRTAQKAAQDVMKQRMIQQREQDVAACWEIIGGALEQYGCKLRAFSIENNNGKKFDVELVPVGF